MNERTGFDPQRLSEGFTGQEHLLGLVARSQTRQDWVEEVAAQTERQSAIFVELINKCPFGIYIVGDDMRIVAMNERSQNGAFRNVRPVIGRLFREAMDILWPAATAQKIVGHFAETLATGRPYYSREFVAPRADTGELEGYEWELQRTKLPGGRLGVICFYFDSTELRTAQRALEESATRQQLLIEELNHRVKNTLMVVQAMALQSFGRDVAADKRDAFQSRLQALAKAHDTLTKVSWDWVSLSEVVAGALEGCGMMHRTKVGGPPVWMQPQTAVSIAMALHELCTNAIKYGALSAEGGQVDLEWTIDTTQSPVLRMSWKESGGPPVTPPQRRGFGSRMLQRALAGALRGTVKLDFAPTGLVCTIEAHNDAVFRV